MALCKKWSDRSQDDLDSAIDRALAKLGYLNRKKEQKEAARCVLQGKDVFVALPTGYGKSCIFQILPACSKLLLEDSCHQHDVHPGVIVVSPLVSLMNDQISKLKTVGIRAVHLTKQFCDADDSSLTEEVSHIFASPEALLQGDSWNGLLLRQSFIQRIVAVAIDEAHCIAKWYVIVLLMYIIFLH